MKVLHITNNYPTEKFPIFGIFVKEQIDSLSRIGIDNDVFFINGRENGKKEYINSIFRLRKHLKTKNYDIIHCHHAYSAVVLFFTFRSCRYKTIISYQNDPIKEGGSFLYRYLRLFSDAIILKNYDQKFVSKKTFYLPNGVDIDFFKPYDKHRCKIELNLNPEFNYILFMDSYKRRRQKRIDRFNETISILKQNGNPLNVQPLILTNTDRQLIPYYINASTLHLLTSDFEGSPNSVKECLACNTKVVSTPVGNVEDLIGDVPGCYISPSFDPSSLAELVIKSIKFSDFQGRSKLIDKNFDIESVALRIEKIYKSL